MKGRGSWHDGDEMWRVGVGLDEGSCRVSRPLL